MRSIRARRSPAAASGSTTNGSTGARRKRDFVFMPRLFCHIVTGDTASDQGEESAATEKHGRARTGSCLLLPTVRVDLQRLHSRALPTPRVPAPQLETDSDPPIGVFPCSSVFFRGGPAARTFHALKDAAR